MAKMFYTMDETRAALGKNEEEIKQFAREGRLREFRDGPRLMFKADQVEALKAELGGGSPTADQVQIAPGGESGAPIGLVDSRGSSGSAIPLADSGAGVTPTKDDTALAADLSGSLGGVPSPGRGGSTMGGKAATGTGVTVFGAEEGVDRADPGAQTAITGGISDQANLESVGSGSGLLDLTRESDDTSLGALALDQTGPGAPRGKRPTAPGETAAGGTLGGTAAESVVVRTPVSTTPVYREAPDPLAPAFAGAALAASAVILFGAYILMSALAGYKPSFVSSLAQTQAWLLAVYGLVITIIFFIGGLFLGKAMR